MKTSCHAFVSLISDTLCDDLDRCLEHLVNLANVAVMGHITKLAAVENQTAIWEYNPDLPGNCVLRGLLDVISDIQTISLKIQASGQCIEYFEKLQIQCKISNPLKIPIHSNIIWGSIHNMLGSSNHLCQVSNQHISMDTLLTNSSPFKPINLFLALADALFGPITTIHANGQVTKKISWSAFHLSDEDWQCVRDV